LLLRERGHRHDRLRPSRSRIADSSMDRLRRGHGPTDREGEERARSRRALTPECLTRGPEGRQRQSNPFGCDRGRFRPFLKPRRRATWKK
jgi:hypothetical protein